MARPLRYLLHEEALVEVTTRTLHGRFLLRPSHELNALFVGVLGRGLEHHPGVALHAVGHASNHYHLLLTTPDAGALADFMCFVNGTLAREAARLYDWPEKYWSRRYRAIEILDEVTAVRRLRYILAHGVKEGLVSSCLEWPGVNSVRALLTDEPLRGTWQNRTLAYEAARRGLELPAEELAVPYEVPLAPLPGWRDLPPDERREKVARLVRDIEEEAAAARTTPPAGAARVLAEHPHHRPSRVARTPAPRCHASRADLHERFRNAYRAFVQAFRSASRAHRPRPPQVPFPAGCFPPAGVFLPPLGTAVAPAPT